MDISFLGGASTVTGSRFLVTTGRSQILIDCGMFQGSPNETVRNRVPLGMDPADLDAILITHAHLDHCGLLPVVVRDGFRGKIFLTSASAELVELVLLDSGRLQEEFAKRHDRFERRHPPEAFAADEKAAARYRAALDEAARAEEEGHVPTSIEPDLAGGAPASPAATNPEVVLRLQPPAIETDLDEPLYTEDDAKAVLPMFQRVKYGAEVEVAAGMVATFVDAGHILGSASIHLEVRESDGDAPTTIVFSGDLGRPGTPILRDPTVMRGADYVVVESTYGGREHEPSEEAVRLLAEAVRATKDAGGVLLIPSFAIGRTQEIVWELDRLIERGEIPQLPLYLDSPMASRASDIYRRHPEFYDEETRKLLDSGSSPLDYPNQIITRSADESKTIATAARPYMIVASNGMLTGGRVVSHLRNLIDDPAATILFVGYQGEGTLGAHLQAGAKTVRLDGATREVKCRVRSISGFSAHADESELLDWIGNFMTGDRAGDPGVPKTIFLVHGDPEAQLAIAPKVQSLGFSVHVPHWRERVTLS
ncbi:MAG: MBL fold metallo-hydrolase [Chloroflexota bacterium]